MKRTKNLILGLFLSTVFVFSACSSSDEDTATCNQANLTAASQEVLTTAQTFSSNPTSGTCAAYKTAVNNFIDIAENCPGTEDEIQTLRDVLAQTVCP